MCGPNDTFRGVESVSQSSNNFHPGTQFHKHIHKKCSHGHGKHHKSSENIKLVEFNDQINNGVNCLQDIDCSVFSLTLSKLRSLYEQILQVYFTNKISHDTYVIISEIGYLHLYELVCIPSSEPHRCFIKIIFVYKSINSINLGSILHHKKVPVALMLTMLR